MRKWPLLPVWPLLFLVSCQSLNQSIIDGLTLYGYPTNEGITVCMGVPCFFNVNAQEPKSLQWIYGQYGQNSQIVFTLAIFTALGWTLTLNFFARRSVGIFSYILFMLFLLYTGLAEWDLVHEISKDKNFEPQ